MAKTKDGGDDLIIGEEMLRDKIYTIRGQKVMLDYDLAEIYGYETKVFNQQVNRNLEKFEGEDFMFKLTREELEFFVRSHFVTSRESGVFRGQSGGVRYLPYAFTEQGIYMLMTVLRGELAVKQSRALIRMFKRMKDYIVMNQETLEYKNNLQLARQVMENAREVGVMRGDMQKLDDEMKKLNNEMDEVNRKLGEAVMKSDISPILMDFSKAAEQREYIFMDGELVKASELFTDIYGGAKKSVYIIDNYISIKTLRHLQNVKKGVEIVIFSDNIGNHLHKVDYDDFRRERGDLKIKFIRTMGIVHDRFIVVDHGAKNETIYHSGASEKDAGKKLMMVSKYNDEIMKDAMRGVIEKLMENEELKLV